MKTITYNSPEKRRYSNGYIGVSGDQYGVTYPRESLQTQFERRRQGSDYKIYSQTVVEINGKKQVITGPESQFNVPRQHGYIDTINMTAPDVLVDREYGKAVNVQVSAPQATEVSFKYD